MLCWKWAASKGKHRVYSRNLCPWSGGRSLCTAVQVHCTTLGGAIQVRHIVDLSLYYEIIPIDRSKICWGRDTFFPNSSTLWANIVWMWRQTEKPLQDTVPMARGDMCAKERLSRRTLHVPERVVEGFAKAVLWKTISLSKEAVSSSGKDIRFSTQIPGFKSQTCPLTVWPWTSYLASLCFSWVATNSPVILRTCVSPARQMVL